MVKPREPKVEFRTITPADARRLLARSKRRNRKPHQSKVREFAAKMLAGKWNPENSQAVSVDWDGNIVNGHTRLLACIEANVPFRTLFLDGVDPATFEEEDTGKARNAADFFVITGMNDYAKANYLATAARAIEFFDRGMWRFFGTGSMSRSPSSVVTNEQLAKAVQRRPVLKKAVEYMAARRRLVPGWPLGMLCAFYVLTHGNPAHDKFWSELVDGLDMPAGSPVRQLKLRVAAATDRGHKVGRPMMAALLAKTWNAYQAGKPIVRLMWAREKGEDFPTPVTRLRPAFPDYLKEATGPAADLAEPAAA